MARPVFRTIGSGCNCPLNPDSPGNRVLPAAILMPCGCPSSAESRPAETNMRRWTARLLLLVMLVPAVAPLALAGTGSSGAMHCQRHPLHESQQAASSGMHCHHGVGSAPRPEAASDSFCAVHSCCENHDCCCRLKTSEWARPASKVLALAGLLIEPASPQKIAITSYRDSFEIDSARGPPHV